MASASSSSSVKMATRIGERGHPEHEWVVDDVCEEFVQLFFQLVRTNKFERIRELGGIYKDIITKTKALPKSESQEDLLRMVYALPTYTRDCVEGKGERDLAYALLISKYEEDHDLESLSVTMMRWVKGSKREAPPGSWKDIVNMCNFVSKWYESKEHCIITRLLGVMSYHLVYDEKSLVAKWAPRESSKKNRWLFYKLVRILNPDVDKLSIMEAKFKSAAKRTRKMISSLNIVIGTLEVKQCGKEWSKINPSEIPSVALQKQKTALLNELRKRAGETRSSDPDRVECAARFRAHIMAASTGKGKISGKKTSIYDLVRDALHGGELTDIQKTLLEEQWKSNGSVVRPGLPAMIPIVDVSGSMSCDKCTPLYYAIGLGLRASEKTHPVFRNRILTFSETPTWVCLSEEDSFLKRVETLSRAPWGMRTNFYSALKLILDSMVENAVSPEDAKSLVLSVFSDMQIDAASYDRTPQAMHDTIKEMYAKEGYEAPHILYWNLRTTNGFPAVSTNKNVTMLSGFSSVLLNVLEGKGIEELHKYTPYRMICDLLNKDRFVM
jgi:hypothetical protein